MATFVGLILLFWLLRTQHWKIYAISDKPDFNARFKKSADAYRYRCSLENGIILSFGLDFFPSLDLILWHYCESGLTSPIV